MEKFLSGELFESHPVPVPHWQKVDQRSPSPDHFLSAIHIGSIRPLAWLAIRFSWLRFHAGVKVRSLGWPQFQPLLPMISIRIRFHTSRTTSGRYWQNTLSTTIEIPFDACVGAEMRTRGIRSIAQGLRYASSTIFNPRTRPSSANGSFTLPYNVTRCQASQWLKSLTMSPRTSPTSWVRQPRSISRFPVAWA